MENRFLMERDFLGLSSKEPLAMVKEEASTDGCKEIGFAKWSGASWPFTNNVSAIPQLLSFKVAQEDKTKNISDPLVPSAFMSFSNASVYDPNRKHSVAEIPKSSNYNREDGSHFSLNAYPVEHDVHSLHHPLDTKAFPVSNCAISSSMPNPVGNTFFSKNNYATTGQSVAMTTIKPQVVGGAPVSSQLSTLPSMVSGSSAKVSAASAQLTIFYAGSVNVYDGVSPEKAQAIMLLAGNGSSSTQQPKVQVQVPSPKLGAVDVTPVNQPCSQLSSPISIYSNTSSHSASGSISTEEIGPAKTTIAAPTPITNLEPAKPTTIIGSVGSVTTTTIIPSVPQARKASLARFLEKRKERAMNMAPYNLSKKSLEGTPLQSNKVDFSASIEPLATISFFGNQVK